jgi:hypothetical protein
MQLTRIVANLVSIKGSYEVQAEASFGGESNIGELVVERSLKSLTFYGNSHNIGSFKIKSSVEVMYIWSSVTWEEPLYLVHYNISTVGKYLIKRILQVQY